MLRYIALINMEEREREREEYDKTELLYLSFITQEMSNKQQIEIQINFIINAHMPLNAL